MTPHDLPDLPGAADRDAYWPAVANSGPVTRPAAGADRPARSHLSGSLFVSGHLSGAGGYRPAWR